MPRLPKPGSDDGQWGHILNEFLGVSHASDGTLQPGVVTEQKLSPAVQQKLNSTPNHNHDNRYYTEAEVDAALSGKADASHTQTAATITDLTETVQDTVSNLLVAGSNTTISYDDTAGKVTIGSTGGGIQVDPDGTPYILGESPYTDDTALTTHEKLNSRIAAAMPCPLQNVAVTTIDPTTGVWVADAIGDTFYGSRQGKIWRSNDGVSGWTEVCNVPAGGTISNLLPTPDGEVVAVMLSGVYKSAGWGTGSVSWTQKVTPNGTAQPHPFGASGGDPANPGSSVCQKIIVTEYGPGSSAGSQAWIDSRYAHISTDGGNTWKVAFDSAIDSAGSAAGDSHLHGCAYDAWADRFYVSEGHGAAGGIYHSTNNNPSPGNWALAPGMAIGQAGSASPTSITATDYGLVIGGDSDNMQGVYGVVRMPDLMQQQLTYLWAWRTSRSGNNGWGYKAVRDRRTGLVYIAWRCQGAGLRPLITAGSPFGADVVWESKDTIATNDRLEYMGITDSGRLAAWGTITGVSKVITAHLGFPAATSRPDTGGVLGGRAADATSIAIGRGASDDNKLRGVAIGIDSMSHQDSVVVGNAAQAGGASTAVIGSGAVGSGSSVSVGHTASATGGAGVAVGAAATAASQGVSVGRNAKTSILNTAVGYGAEALVGQNSTALGINVKTTGSEQVAVGARHIELGEVAAEPGAPAANTARLFVRDNGAGKTQLCVRFATGAIQVIATEP